MITADKEKLAVADFTLIKNLLKADCNERFAPTCLNKVDIFVAMEDNKKLEVTFLIDEKILVDIPVIDID